jgi:succinate-acetate transporter protein
VCEVTPFPRLDGGQQRPVTDADSSIHPSVRIFVRPVASALPLGFFAFGIGMLLVGGLGLGWIPAHESRDVGLFLVSFVFPLEFLAAVVAFLARDTLGAATLGLFAGSWLSLGLASLVAEPAARSVTTGFYLLALSGAVVILAAVAVAGKPFFTLLLGLSAVRAVLAGIYEIWGGRGIERVGGGIGIAIGVIAFYGGLALCLEDLRQGEVLPLFRRGAAAAAFEEGLAGQLERVAGEAGVRQQL